MQRGFFLGFLFLAVLGLPQNGFGLCDPTFSANPITLPIAAQKTQDISLRTLLGDPHTGEALDWDVFGTPSPPSWISIDKPNEKITATPPLSAVGSHRFNLAVQCSGGEEGDSAQIILQVQIIPQWKHAPAELFLGDLREGQTFQMDLRSHVTTADNSTNLTFTETGLAQNAPWLKLNANGTLSGVPERAHLGVFRNIIFKAIHPSSGAASTFANGKVVRVAQAPKWKSNPLLLPTAKQGEPYAQDLRPQVVHSEPAALRFEKTGGPSWVSVNASTGVLSGTPPNNGSTQASVGLRVSFTDDGKLLEDSTTAQFQIENLNRPPQWIADPLELPKAKTGLFYRQDLRRSVVDPDGDTLAFRIVDGPGWANLTLEGSFEGTPAASDAGTKTWTAEVTDGVHKVRGRIIVPIEKTNTPPRWKNNPTVLPDADEDALYAKSLAPYVEDADGDPLTFVLLSSSGRNWITVSPSGEIRGTPKKEDIGTTTFRIRVADGQPGHNAVADVKITVKHVNHAPFWVLDPIRLFAKEDTAYEESVANYAKDIDGDNLIFQKVSGVPWLNITPQGLLKGTPSQPHLGENKIVVKVSDPSGASEEASIIVSVEHTNHEPQWTTDPVRIPSAKEDALYSEDLKPFVQDIDANEELSFSIISGKPSWLNLTTDGIVTGVPKKSNLGEHSFKVRVIDKGHLFADATVRITVVKVNKPPRWTQPIIDLGTTPEQSPYQFDLSDFAEDPDGDRLSYKLLDGPTWMLVDSNGIVTGTPKQTDVGSFTALFEVSDGQYAAQGQGKIVVLDVNQPPVFQQNPIKIAVKARDTLFLELNAPEYVVDPDKDTLRFDIKDPTEWIALGTNGRLTAIPKPQHVGTHSFTIDASDGEFSPRAVLEITVTANPEPPVWLEDPIRMEAAVGQPFTSSLVSYAKDFAGQPLSFSAVGSTAWLTVASNGRLSGTPPQNGESRFTVRVANQFGHADASLRITVGNTQNKPPVWLENPITLVTAKIGVSYDQSVAVLAKDFDGDALSFSKVPNSGADWVFVTSNGSIVGTPQSIHEGPNTFTIRVTDSKQASADATVRVSVSNGGGPNTPPEWIQNPIPLGNAQVAQTFSKDISSFAKDIDGDALTFTPVDIPGWLTLRTDGLLLGVPRPGDVGAFTASFRVSDGKASATVSASGQVASQGNQAPVWNLEALSFIVQAGTPFSININQPQYIKDPENETIRFGLVTTPLPDWVSVSSTGDLSIRARAEHVNQTGHQFLVRASDTANNSSDATMNIKVVENQDIKPPLWLEKPLRLTAKVGQQFALNISDKARDPNQPPRPLSFAKIANPTWISMSPSGTLSAFPQSTHAGEHQFQITVSNDVGTDTNTVLLTVSDGAPHSDNFVIDKPVPNAATEVLWVIDNSWNWFWIFKDKMTKEFQTGISAFYSELNSAGIKHTSVFISTDAHRKGGLPISDDNSRQLLRWDDSQWVRSFNEFIDNILVRESYSSPLWSMKLFYEKVPNLWEIYQNGYMEPGVPMDAMIVSKQVDQFKRYASSAPHNSWGPTEYADDFVRFHKGEQKPYHISAIAAACPQLLDPYEQPVYAGPQSSYQDVAIRTGGDYYPWNCNADMSSYLRDFAQKVKRRAYIHANKRFTLSKKPLDATKIVVKLGTKVLTGNNGSPGDQWRYDSFSNEILVFWHNIDTGSVPAGTQLVIEYQGTL